MIDIWEKGETKVMGTLKSNSDFKKGSQLSGSLLGWA